MKPSVTLHKFVGVINGKIRSFEVSEEQLDGLVAGTHVVIPRDPDTTKNCRNYWDGLWSRRNLSAMLDDFGVENASSVTQNR